MVVIFQLNSQVKNLTHNLSWLMSSSQTDILQISTFFVSHYLSGYVALFVFLLTLLELSCTEFVTEDGNNNVSLLETVH